MKPDHSATSLPYLPSLSRKLIFVIPHLPLTALSLREPRADVLDMSRRAGATAEVQAREGKIHCTLSCTDHMGMDTHMIVGHAATVGWTCVDAQP